MSNMYYDGTVEIENNGMCIEVDVRAEATGYWKAGDSFGYGCEPPDEGDFKAYQSWCRKRARELAYKRMSEEEDE